MILLCVTCGNVSKVDVRLNFTIIPFFWNLKFFWLIPTVLEIHKTLG